MQNGFQSISVRGRPINVTCLDIGNTRIATRGRFLQSAVIQDEDWLPQASISSPIALVDAVKKSNLAADIFSFSQRIPETQPLYPFPFEWDNAAVVPITTFRDWWENRLPQESRKNTRRAGRRGVVIKQCFL